MTEEDDKYVVVFPKIPRKSTRKGQSFTKEILELVPDRTVGTKKMTLQLLPALYIGREVDKPKR